MVCGNLATHKAPVIQAWLARHPRFRLHFTPTGYPGLIPACRLRSQGRLCVNTRACRSPLSAAAVPHVAN